jgi:hypothetical protein
MIPDLHGPRTGGRPDQELLAEAERRRVIAAVPAGPGAVQRFALRVAGWGRRPVVVRRPAAPAPRACGPLAI